MSPSEYPSYKHSGVEWMGLVPAHWAVASLKTGFDVRLGKMLQPDAKSPEDELRPYLRAANIQWNGIDRSDIKSMWFSPQEQVQLQLRFGDLLVSEGGDVGRSTIWRDELVDCLFQNSVNRVRSRSGNDTRFLYYWLAALKAKGYVDVICNKSTIAHFTAEKVAAVPVPFPPVPEQTAIAAFLDRETGKIDALVDEQRRLIELLKEKRQAVISHAVTKGLNPDAPMKDTGIEWLGEVPEHWCLLRMKDVCEEIVDCKNRTPDEHPDDPFFVVRTSCVRDGKFHSEGGYFTNAESFEEWTRKGRPQLGDVLFTREAPAGEACLMPDGYDLCLGQRMMYLRPDPNMISSDFLLASIYGPLARHQIDAKSKGSTVGHLRVGEVGELPCLFPPLDEQSVLAEELTKQSKVFDQLQGECHSSIALLQERRVALISAAVTGKIDVRGLVETREAAE